MTGRPVHPHWPRAGFPREQRRHHTRLTAYRLAKGLQHALGVVPCDCVLADRTSHRRHTVPPGGAPISPGRSRPACRSRIPLRLSRRRRRARWPAPGGLYARAHQPQRLGDTLHGPARERLVADQGRVECLAGQQSREETAWRCLSCPCPAGIPGALQPEQADAIDAEVRVIVADHVDAHGLDRGQRRQAVLARQEPADFSAALVQLPRSMIARCETDLSPGTRIRPSIARPATRGNRSCSGPAATRAEPLPTARSRRSFCSGRPTVIRRCCGSP